MISLRKRLLISTLVGSVILTISTGIFLSILFSVSTEKQFDNRLQTTLTDLVGATQVIDGQAKLNLQHSAPNYSNLYSGWYWQVFDIDGEKSLYKSNSLDKSSLWQLFNDATKRRLRAQKNDVYSSYSIGPVGHELRVYAQYIRFPELEKPILYIVSGNSELLNAEARSFYWMIGAGLFLLVVGLLIGALFQLKFVLKPLENLKNHLAEIRVGNGESIEANLPIEIMPVANEINSLIDANKQVIDRARTHVGNLAHTLKTPISVLLNASDNKTDENSKLVFEQVKLMNVQITHHLNRARMIASVDTVATKVHASPVANSIINALKKIYFDKNVKVEFSSAEQLCFYGEKQDFEELIGNLLDNAFKWCDARVSVRIDAQDNQKKSKQLHIVVEDDGPFMPAKELKKVLQRGHRIDENMQGTGLGLSIVKELVTLYDGEFTLCQSDLGGLKAELWLPLA